MIIETLSTFPEMYHSVMGASMMKRAQDKGIISFTAYDLRDWTYDRHRTTDDDPYGGGAGLVMKCQPIFEAVEDLSGKSAHYWEDEPACPRTGPAPRHADGPAPTVVFLAPQGQRFDDQLANRLAKSKRLLFVCGHYEGIDERAYALADEVISLGDYVLTSGELASMVVIDAVVRKIPAFWGPKEAPMTNPSPTVCWSTPSTPGRRSFAEWRCRRRSPAATTLWWPNGAASRAWSARPASAPTCWRRRRFPTAIAHF